MALWYDVNMKKSLNPMAGWAVGLTIGLAIAIPAASFAAGVVLTNGGLGQVASNPSQFGVAVCNGGFATVSQSVPVSIAVNGQTATISSAASIAPGACQYSYVSYDQLGMQAGQTYSATATIDPQASLISNTDNQATYSVTVPGTLAVATQPAPTADVNAQSGNIFASFWHWLVNLF
jgi:hypothetical protein